MKPIDVKALAEEAGFIFWSDGWRAGKIDWSCDYDEDLQRFADLVEAQVQERFRASLLDAVGQAIATEREACARAALDAPIKTARQDTREACAAAIRARGEA